MMRPFAMWGLISPRVAEINALKSFGWAQLLIFLDMWPGVTGDLSVCANRAHNNLEPYSPYRLYYDGSSPMMNEFRRLGVNYGVRAINFGGAVGGPTKTL